MLPSAGSGISALVSERADVGCAASSQLNSDHVQLHWGHVEDSGDGDVLLLESVQPPSVSARILVVISHAMCPQKYMIYICDAVKP